MTDTKTAPGAETPEAEAKSSKAKVTPAVARAAFAGISAMGPESAEKVAKALDAIDFTAHADEVVAKVKLAFAKATGAHLNGHVASTIASRIRAAVNS